MKNANIKLGAECYTWFMKDSGKGNENQLDRMVRVTAKAGFTGIEPIFGWMGPLDDPGRLADYLREHGISHAALVLGQEWNHPQETGEERAFSDAAIAFLKTFPDTLLCTVQHPTSRDHLVERRQNLVNIVNSVCRRATDAGIECTFHPNSPPTSTNRTAEDYDVILNGLDPAVCGWTPDVGHIRNGGMDPLEKMKEFHSLINHVHYKDWDGKPEWALMGEGEIDFKAITGWLVEQNFNGWIICEDEADQAIDDPDGVTIHDGGYCERELTPIINS